MSVHEIFRQTLKKCLFFVLPKPGSGTCETRNWILLLCSRPRHILAFVHVHNNMPHIIIYCKKHLLVGRRFDQIICLSNHPWKQHTTRTWKRNYWFCDHICLHPFIFSNFIKIPPMSQIAHHRQSESTNLYSSKFVTIFFHRKPGLKLFYSKFKFCDEEQHN